MMGVLFLLSGFGQPFRVASCTCKHLDFVIALFLRAGLLCVQLLGCSFRHLRSAHVRCGTEILSVGNQRKRTYSFLRIVAAYFGYSRRQTDLKAAGI